MKTKFKAATHDDLVSDLLIFKNIKFDSVIPSPDDDRDFVACVMQKRTFPEEYESKEVEILNQGSVGSCVAHALAAAMAKGEETALSAHNDYSRGYIYGNRRDTDYQGEGMIIREALKQLNHCGDVLYTDFPHNKKYPQVKELIEANKEELAEKALPHAIVEYFRCYTEEDIKQAIMDYGCVVISVPVYSDFGRDLHVTETKVKTGGHAMIITGWTKDKWIVQNSWGKTWGYSGKLLMDLDYPVNEYWGIAVKTEGVEPKKNIFEKIASFFVSLFKKLFKKV